MKFYCPNCRQEREVDPKETITTKSKRVAYKANCPVCDQDMAEFTEFEKQVDREETQRNEQESVAEKVTSTT